MIRNIIIAMSTTFSQVESCVLVACHEIEHSLTQEILQSPLPDRRVLKDNLRA